MTAISTLWQALFVYRPQALKLTHFCNSKSNARLRSFSLALTRNPFTKQRLRLHPIHRSFGCRRRLEGSVQTERGLVHLPKSCSFGVRFIPFKGPGRGLVTELCLPAGRAVMMQPLQYDILYKPHACEVWVCLGRIAGHLSHRFSQCEGLHDWY